MSRDGFPQSPDTSLGMDCPRYIPWDGLMMREWLYTTRRQDVLGCSRSSTTKRYLGPTYGDSVWIQNIFHRMTQFWQIMMTISIQSKILILYSDFTKSNRGSNVLSSSYFSQDWSTLRTRVLYVLCVCVPWDDLKTFMCMIRMSSTSSTSSTGSTSRMSSTSSFTSFISASLG